MLWNPDHHKVNGDLLLTKSIFFLERWPGLYNNEMKAVRDKHGSLDPSLPIHRENWESSKLIGSLSKEDGSGNDDARKQ